MHTVSIDVPFCYGHRLVGHPGKCRYLHGHNGLARVVVTTATGNLTELGMVVDFGDLKKLVKGWVDTHWDHNMVLNQNDPAFALDRSSFSALFGDRLPFKLPYNPTAENMARHLAIILSVMPLFMQQCKLVRVEIHETGSSCAAWEEEPCSHS